MTGADRASIRVAAGVLQDSAGRVLLAWRGDDQHAGGAWEFPGGKLEPGETPRAGLDRELEEEIGIRVQQAESLLDYAHSYSDRDVRLHVFRVTGWSGEPRGLENQPLCWVAVRDLPATDLLVADRPIVDALEQLSKS